MLLWLGTVCRTFFLWKPAGFLRFLFMAVLHLFASSSSLWNRSPLGGLFVWYACLLWCVVRKVEQSDQQHIIVPQIWANAFARRSVCDQLHRGQTVCRFAGFKFDQTNSLTILYTIQSQLQAANLPQKQLSITDAPQYYENIVKQKMIILPTRYGQQQINSQSLRRTVSNTDRRRLNAKIWQQHLQLAPTHTQWHSYN